MKKVWLLFLTIGLAFFLMSCKEKEDLFLASHLSEILYIGLTEGAGIKLDEIDITKIEANKVFLVATEEEKHMEATILLVLIFFEENEEDKSYYVQSIEYTDDKETHFNVELIEEGRAQYDLDVIYYQTVDIHQDPKVEVKTYELSKIMLDKDDVDHYINLSFKNFEDLFKEKFIHNINMITDASLEISLDGINFMTTITSEMMKSLSISYLDAWHLEHVSSYDGENFYRLFHSEINYIDEGYISFPIYFRSRIDESVYLDFVILDSKLRSMMASQTFIDSKANTVLKGASFDFKLTDSMRISFIGQIQNEKHIVIYENPASDTNTYMGKLKDVNLHGSQGSLDYFYKLSGYYPYLASAVRLPETISNFREVKVLEMTQIDDYYEGMIIINLWVEGWDREAYGIFDRDDIKLDLRFSGR